MPSTLLRKLDRSNIARAMGGTNPAFAQPQDNNFQLPQNYTIDDLARYQQQQQQAFGQLSQNDILGLADDYSKDAATRRSALASSLLDQGQKTFDLENPQILEDLNSRGLATSASAVGGKQTDALKQIALESGQQLNDFDTSTFNELNSLKGSGVTARLQSQQDALDQELNLRTSKLNQSFQEAQAAQEQAMAEKLAKEQSRNQLTNTLIGSGTNLLGAGILAKGGGLFGGGATGTTGTAASGLGIFGAPGVLGGTAYGTPGMASSSLFPGGLGQVGTAGSLGTSGTGSIGLGGGAAIAGAGIGSAILARAVEKKLIPALGQTGGQTASYFLNPVGSTINFGKDLLTDPKKKIQNIGNSITDPIKSVGSAISGVFCFEAGTPIDMEDGSQRPIGQLYIGAETKGGKVKSLRTAEVEDGDRFLWKGIRITGKHAVKEEGKWIRVEDSPHSDVLKGGGIVWSIVTEKHRVWSNGLEMADEVENDDYEHLSIEQSLERLNAEEKAAL